MPAGTGFAAGRHHLPMIPAHNAVWSTHCVGIDLHVIAELFEEGLTGILETAAWAGTPE
jgi:hypothetical protein